MCVCVCVCEFVRVVCVTLCVYSASNSINYTAIVCVCESTLCSISNYYAFPCISHRGMGSVFRKWYGEVSQLRSLLPNGIPFVALTATSTIFVRRIIIDQLLMENVAMIEASPERRNIRYSVVQASRDLYDSFKWLIERLRTCQVETPKTLVFCRTIHTCSSLFKLFLYELRDKAYYPHGSVPSVQTRIFAMYHAKVDTSDKTQILHSFRNQQGTTRVLFSTIAFGMGVDISDIRFVIHYGPSSDIDDYFQESGRAGRDGRASDAILYLYGGCLLGHVSRQMKEYCKTDQCRRQCLLGHFGYKPAIFDNSSRHACCDICKLHCQCEGYTCKYRCDVAEHPLSVKEGHEPHKKHD